MTCSARNRPDGSLELLLDEGLLQQSGSNELAFSIRSCGISYARSSSTTFPAWPFILSTGPLPSLRMRGRSHLRWDEAFELAVESEDKTQAAEIAGQAARTLLAAGQSETLEKWLAACGAAGVTVARASLAQAEILIRKGEMSTAAAVASDTAARLTDGHSDYAWACNLAGRALHFTSEEDAAFERFKEARRTAKTDEDTKEALWGLALVAVEIDPGAASTFLDELESDYPNDLDIRFRLAAGRAVASEQLSSLADVWPQFQALLPSIQHSQDPLAASCFLAIGAAMSVMTGSYSRGRDLADHALAICNELRLDFGLGTCLAHRAAAEIGMRHFSKAQRTLRAFERTPICREDPFFRLEGLKLKARLLASQGALDEAIATQADLPPGRCPDRPLGVFLSTISILHAARGDAVQALATARTARGHGSSVEMRYGSLLAEAIATSANGDSEDFRRRYERRSRVRAGLLSRWAHLRLPRLSRAPRHHR